MTGPTTPPPEPEAARVSGEGDIATLAVRPGGVAIVALWPPVPCVACSRLAALGTIRYVRESNRNEFRCAECTKEK